MFKLSTKSLDFEPKNGVDVVASGEVSFYKVRGNLQFRVRKMQEAGLGDLYIAFEKLKKKLDKEGLFKDKKQFRNILKNRSNNLCKRKSR